MWLFIFILIALPKEKELTDPKNVSHNQIGIIKHSHDSGFMTYRCIGGGVCVHAWV